MVEVEEVLHDYYVIERHLISQRKLLWNGCENSNLYYGSEYWSSKFHHINKTSNIEM